MTVRPVVTLLLLVTATFVLAPAPAGAASCEPVATCQANVAHDETCTADESIEGETCTTAVSVAATDGDAVAVSHDSEVSTGHVYGQDTYNDWFHDRHDARVTAPGAERDFHAWAEGYASVENAASDVRSGQVERGIGVHLSENPTQASMLVRFYHLWAHTCQVESPAGGVDPGCATANPHNGVGEAQSLIVGVLP